MHEDARFALSCGLKKRRPYEPEVAAASRRGDHLDLRGPGELQQRHVEH
jgi:hypothetical protein